MTTATLDARRTAAPVGAVATPPTVSELAADLLTLQEAASRLGCCTRSLGRWHARGRLKVVKLPNGKPMVPAREVDRLLREFAKELEENPAG